MGKESKSFVLKLSSAIAIDGEVVSAGNLVEVDEPTAKNLLHRGKAVLATAEDGVDFENDDNDLSKLKKPQLLELAIELEIEGAKDMNVDGLRAAIEAKRAE